MAENDYRRMVFVVGVSEPSSGGHGQVEDILRGGCVALKNGVLYLTILIFDGVGAHSEFGTEEPNPRRHGLHMRQVFNRLFVFESQFLARTHGFGRTPERKRL